MIAGSPLRQGSREAPFCKFSKAAVGALDRTGVAFDTFNVFQVSCPPGEGFDPNVYL